MSEQAGENEPSAASAFGDYSAFAELMDTLVGDEENASAGQAAGADAGAAGTAVAPGGVPAGAAAAGGADAGGAGAAGAGAVGGPVDTGAAGPTAGAPVAGADGAVRGDGAGAPAAGDAPAGAAGGADAAGGGAAGGSAAAAAVDHAVVVPLLGELSTKLEERVTSGFMESAMTEARAEHGQYFEALEKHPRLLVGTQVPRIDGKDGVETLRDTADAREWQEAVKGLLVSDVKDRASRAMDENAPYLQTLHASIELFQKNGDLVPGTKGFDRELADEFATLAKPYELRGEDGKLNGYSIPVQPIIDQLRTQVTARRAAKPAAPVAGSPAGTGAAAPSAAAPVVDEPPQAGITSKAGSTTEVEDFSTLFGTIGLPNFTI